MPSKEMRQVEVFRCWNDGHWDTDFVEIPDNTEEADVEHDASQAGYDAIVHSADQPFFIGLYWDPGCSMEESLGDMIETK